MSRSIPFRIEFLVAVLLLMLSSLRSNSQNVEVEYGLTAAELAERINGNGVQILNPVLTCADSASGGYLIESITGFPDGPGAVLTTGNIADVRGPNLSESTTTEWDTPGDPFLTSLIGNTTFDGCALEFDVVPVGDTLRFNFTFASEEYSEYVGTPFNDAFGFFISGPGITGEPEFDGAENLAVLPGTNTPVEINTINNGNPDIGFPAVNPEFYNDNPLGFENLIQYDGWTIDLVAEKIVTPCDTFHLKLVIADGADREWDSAVFIEEIQSNNISLASSTDGDIDNMIEGCNNGTVTFTRFPVTDQDVTVTYFIGGTATNGTDYPLIGTDPDPSVPKFITIPANQASASVSIFPIDDGVVEGDETAIFYVGNPNCVGTIQDSLIFTIQDSLNLVINPPLAFVCLGDSLTFMVQSEASTFNWTPGDFLNDPTLQNPTTTPTNDITYILEAGVASCTSQAIADIFVTDVQLSASVTDILCGGENTGAIDLTVTGAQPPIEYEWVGPNGFTSADEDLINLEAGTYIVLVTDRDGCTATLEVEVAENPPLIGSVDSPTFTGGENVSCFSASDGQATATIEGGTPPYSFLWNDPGAQTGQTATGLSAGEYTVVVTDANGCSLELNITLTEPEIVTGVLLDRTDVLCNGDATGSAIIEAIGGNPPYTYVWNSVPPQSGPEITGVPAGFYTATITDVNGCLGSLEIEIQQPDDPLSGTVDVQNLLCNNDASGSATANITGGTSPYTYIWSPDPGLNNPIITGLSAGNYNLNIVDANDCELNIPFNILEPAELELQVVLVVDVDCSGDDTGSATVAASGGTGPYTYEWDTDPVTTGPTLSDVSAGTYTVLVTDANSCTDTLEIIISEPTPITIDLVNQVNPSCFGESTGQLEVLASGGTAPLTYTWNTIPPTDGSILSNVPEGSYTVTVSDDNGCEASETYTIGAPTQIEIELINLQNVLCNGESTGSATISITGGTPDYAILWSDPGMQTTETASNLAAGTYTVTITDANLCVASLEITIAEPEFPLGGNVINVQDVLCFGDATGQITVEGTGGSGSYSYQWDDPNGQQTPTASGLDPGTYTVTITDNNGCPNPVELVVVVNGPTEDLEITLTPSIFGGGFNVACSGDSTATIMLDITGGTAPHDILWNLDGLDTSTDQNLADLPAGTYGVLVTDANGCTVEDEITLTAPEPISITFTTSPSLCFGIPTGSIEITIDGGVPSYDVSWTGPNGFTSSDLILTDLEGGIYNLTITDDNGCIYEDAITVTQPEDIIITVDSLSDFNGFNTTCWYTEDGAIYTTTDGGTLPYTIQWNTPGMPDISDQEDLENVGPGNYELVVIDANGCVQNEFVDLISPDTIDIVLSPSLYPNGFNISCFGEADGSVLASATGGVPGYTFTWTGTGGFGPTNDNPIENLQAGEYNVLVEDVNGCFVESSVILVEPDTFGIDVQSPLINGTNISCNGAADGSIDLITFGGEPPFTISWTGPNGFTSTDEDIFDLEAGEYCVTVTDANDCVQQACITLTEPDPIIIDLTPSVFINGTNLSCNDSNDGFITTSVSGGNSPYIYSWFGPGNFTSTFPDIFGLAPGEYCLTVADENGCEEVQCITLTAPPPIEIILDEYIPSDCAGDNTASISVTVIGGDPAYTYAWTGPNGFTANTQDISDLEPGTYCLLLTDVGDCTAENCFVVTEPSPLSATLQTTEFNGGFEIDCNGNNTGGIITIPQGGTAPYTATWTGPDGFSSNDLNLDGLFAGTYCLELLDANNCLFNQCIDITEPSLLISDPIVTLPDCGDGTPATIDLNVSGGVAPYLFNWSTNDDTEIVDVEEGVYTVLITDANNCSIEEDFNIILPSSIIVVPNSPLFGGFNIACNGDFTGSITIDVFGGVGDLSAEWTGPNGFTSTDANITGLESGTYCVTITDDLGCTGDTCITLTQPEALTAVLDATNVSCNGGVDGSISANIVGGVPAYSVSWTGPNGFTAIGTEISGLEPGNYCANVTDFNGCTTQSCIDIAEPDLLNISLDSPEIDGVNILCFGDNTGVINSTVTGGTSPYSYSWTGPGGFASMEPNLNNVFAGEYCLTITDANNCTETECITLTQGPELIFTFNVFEYPNGFNVSCNGECDGSLEAILSGGGPEPYSLEWQGPNGFSSDQLVLSDLCAGTYSLIVTDANDCVQSGSITLTQPDLIDIDLESPVFGGGFEISCFGENTGVINTTVSGGVGDYSYSWTGPDSFTSDEPNLINLFAGTYLLVVTDDSGCTNSAEITLEEPAETLNAGADPFEFPSGDNISCLGANDGSIESNATGGTPPYIYNWNGPNDFTSNDQNISDLEPGFYTLVVEDLNGCVFTVNVELTEPDTEIESELTVVSDILCNDDETGALEVAATGGSGDYTILWTGPDSFISDQFEIDNLIAGTYTYLVEDINGCQVSGAHTFIEPTPISIIGEVINAECETPTGSINLTVNGGTPDYQYLWDDEDGTTDQDLINVVAGIYSVVVTDNNGCIETASFEIATFSSLVIEGTVLDLSCNNDSTGSIETKLVQGAEPVSYSWSGPNGFESDQSNIENLSAGDYQLNAIDINGCEISLDFSVNEPEELIISDLEALVYDNGFNLSGFESGDGVIFQPEITGGTPDYAYAWSSENGYESETGNNQLNLEAGTYILVVTDLNQCTDTAFIKLEQPIPIEIPNGISPNADGLNDGLIVRGLEDFPNNRLLVFNRWGNQVYEETNYRNNSPWFGVNNGGEEIPEGTYYVVVELDGRDALRGYLEVRR